MTSTLYDYYTSQGKALPSVQDRTASATSAGISNYTGTADQNTQLLSYLQKSSDLPTASAPSNVSNIKTGITTPVMPTTTPTSGNISSANAANLGAATFYDTQSQQQQDIATKAAAERDALIKSSQDQAKPFLDKLLGSKPTDQVRSEAQAKTGIDPTQYFADEKAKVSEIASLTNDYNAAVAAKDAQVAALTGQGKGIPIDLLNNQAAQIERNAAPKLNELSANINAKTAVLKATQGLYQEAQTFVNEAVSSATADTKYNADMYQSFLNLNKDSISRLDGVYQDALSSSLKAAQNAHEENVQQKTQIGKLLVDNPTAGITMNDTLEQAYAKAAASPTAKNTDTQVIEVNGQKVLINSQTGATIKNLGAATTGSTAPKTAGERAASAVASLQTLISSGQTLKDGTPVTDPEGYATPVAWKALIAQAPSEGLTRAQFIQQFGYLLYLEGGNVSSKYGLTPSEVKLLTGSVPSTL